jgi:hypothetical protein
VPRFVFALIGVTILSNISSASEPTFLGEALIHADDGASLDPLSISQSGTGGFYVTGSSGGDGWVVKTDAKGNVIWRYDLRAELDRSKFQSAKILGAATFQSGNTYLCAELPRSVGSTLPSSLLLRLDDSGHEIDRRPFSPNSESQKDGTYLNANARCLTWGSDFAFVGYEKFIASDRTQTIVDHRITFPQDKSFYWIVVFDEDGRVKKEWRIPSDLTSLAVVGAAYVSGDTLLFSVTDNENTNVVAIDARSNSITKEAIAGSAEIITPDQSNKDFQVLSIGKSSANIVHLDTKLQVQGERTIPLDRFVGSPYGLSDGSLAIFGSRVHALGETYTTGIALLGPALDKATFVDLPRSAAPTSLDGGRIAAVTPGYKAGEFVFARKLIQGLKANDPSAAPMFRGAVIDFVHIN